MIQHLYTDLDNIKFLEVLYTIVEDGYGFSVQ